MIKLIFPETTLSDLAERMRREARESFALILARPGPVARKDWRLLVTSIHEPLPEDYEVRTETFVRPSAAFRLNLEKRARQQGLSLIYCHSHPAEGGIPEFSAYDDGAEPALAAYAAERVRDTPHLSLIVGAEGVRARELGCGAPVDVFEVGRRVIQHFPRYSNLVANEHDRQIRAFGEAGQRAIQALTVVIVGLGGTGSLVAQQLAYLGVRRFILIDPDVIDETSLNRVVGAIRSDIGKPKVAVARRMIRRLVKDAKIVALQHDILERVIGERVKKGDFVFCCTDSHGSRHFINQLAYQYFMPCIDMGVVINIQDERITHIDGRVKMLGPGMGCLLCQGGILSPIQVRWDLSNQAQRNADPYFSASAGITQPSVISLNSTVTSQAVTMFLAAVAGIPVTPRSQHYRGIPGVIRAIDDTPADHCVNCSREAFYGRGATCDLPSRTE